MNRNLAPTPPMGWNSFDCFAEAVNEEEVLAAADAMVANLLTAGYDTLVIDAGWSIQTGSYGEGWEKEVHAMDGVGRFEPDPDRFPSARDGRGFRNLADRLHGLGLRFGIHHLRGIPRRAVKYNLPVLGGRATAEEIADPSSTCIWSDRMFGLRADHPEAQTYVDSLFAQWAEWGVDYVKLDDIASPYYTREVEMAALAIERCGRPIVLSLSPGDTTPSDHVEHVRAHADLWRISADFWDRWTDLRRNFDLLARWNPHSGQGAWADADMLPVGDLCQRNYGPDMPPRRSRFTPDEVDTLITLWCIARSPLMIGGVLSSLTDADLALLTDPLRVGLNQRGVGPREVFREDSWIVWTSHLDGERVTAVFNVGEEAATAPAPWGVVVPPHGVRIVT